MFESIRIATPRAFLWHAATWLSVIFALLTLMLPMAVLWAAALVVLPLALGSPSCKSLLRLAGSRRIALWWLGLSVSSLVAFLAKWMLLAMPFPRYSDYGPPEYVSPFRQAFLDNAEGLYWGAGWTAVVATLAAALILPLVLEERRTVQLIRSARDTMIPSGPRT